jgi:hypothetical protein
MRSGAWKTYLDCILRFMRDGSLTQGCKERETERGAASTFYIPLEGCHWRCVQCPWCPQHISPCSSPLSFSTCAIVFLSARHCPFQCLPLVLGLIEQTWHCNFVSTFTMALCQTHKTFGPSKCITNVDYFLKINYRDILLFFVLLDTIQGNL